MPNNDEASRACMAGSPEQEAFLEEARVCAEAALEATRGFLMLSYSSLTDRDATTQIIACDRMLILEAVISLVKLADINPLALLVALEVTGDREELGKAEGSVH